MYMLVSLEMRSSAAPREHCLCAGLAVTCCIPVVTPEELASLWVAECGKARAPHIKVTRQATQHFLRACALKPWQHRVLSAETLDLPCRLGS